jgi:hypothetical protein
MTTDKATPTIDQVEAERAKDSANYIAAHARAEGLLAQRDALREACRDALHQLTAMREPVYGSDEYTEGAADNLRAAIALCERGEK